MLALSSPRHPQRSSHLDIHWCARQGVSLWIPGEDRSGSLTLSEADGHAERSEVRERQRPDKPVGYADQHRLEAQQETVAQRRIRRIGVARFAYALFLYSRCSTAGALAEVWNARLSGELVGTYRFGHRHIFRAASVRTGLVPLHSGHFGRSHYWCPLAPPYGCPFMGGARDERRSSSPSERVCSRGRFSACWRAVPTPSSIAVEAVQRSGLPVVTAVDITVHCLTLRRAAVGASSCSNTLGPPAL